MLAAYVLHLHGHVRTDEHSFLLDGTQESPQEGRELMSDGMAQMKRGAYPSALEYFTRALRYAPNNSALETKLGIVNGALADAGDHSRTAEAERHFLRSISLAPNDDNPHAGYGAWLYRHGRTPDAIAQLKVAVVLNPLHLAQRDLLIQAETSAGDLGAARQAARDALRQAPDDSVALQALQNLPAHYATYWIYLSLTQYQQGRFQECIESARKALLLEPDNAEAYNNIGAAFGAMQQWDEAIRNAKKALELNPDFKLARNNLAWALAQKAAHR